jgi:hypothetical protein
MNTDDESLDLPDEWVVAQDGIDITTQQEYVTYVAAPGSEDYSSEAIDGKVQR